MKLNRSMRIKHKKERKVIVRRAACIIIVLLFIVAVKTSFAEDDKSSSVDLGSIFVSEDDWTYGATGVSVIGKEDITQVRDSRTVDGLFENTAGIDLRRQSYGGNTGNNVYLRGFDSSRYVVMIDGRPLTGVGVYGGNYVDWASLSTDDIEKVEIIRGTESAEYGNTLGGTINIVTRQGTDKTKINIRSSCGSYGTVDAAVSQSGNLGKFFYEGLSYGFWTTKGYLRNNFNTRNNFDAKLNLILPWDFNAGIGAKYTDQDRGFVVENREGSSNFNSTFPESAEYSGGGPNIQWWGKPGPGGAVRSGFYWGDGSYWNDKRGQYDITLKKSFDTLDFTAQAYTNREERTEYYYAINNSSKLVLQRYSEPEESWGLLLKMAQSVGKHIIKYGYELYNIGYGGQDIRYADRSYFRTQPTNSDGSDSASRRNAAYVQGTLVVSPSVDVNAGIRYDYYTSHYPSSVVNQGLGPRIGLVYRPWPDVELTGSFGQAYRFPTQPETYWYSGGYQVTNRKALSPERALQTDFGIAKKFSDKAKVGVRGYYYYVYDYIRTIFGYTPSRVVYNIDNVMLAGFETEAEYALSKEIAAFVNYTYQTTTKKGDILDANSSVSNNLTELPVNKVNAGLKYRYRGFTGDFVMRFVSDRQELTGSSLVAAASNYSDLSKFATFDLNLKYKMLDNKNYSGNIGLNIGNIFNARYEETAGFPMPGTTVTGGVDVQF